ncbi:F-box protein CPR1-like [Lycium ferocissimum]|uniref:F-box protein CPR1-like n=1 Tax=Lycium ferocissimum TaxID=112874 RepID=UPI002814D38E|nr:F-box protein CPR1-like [Lycium ferocissimum]
MMEDGIMKKYPKDVVIHILLRLPVKFLLRFKCLSKTLCTLIQSSTFINIHLNRTTTSTDYNILLKRSVKEDVERDKAIFSFLSSDGDDYPKSIYPDLDVPYIKSRFSISHDLLFGPIHGLIALMVPTTTILFNPSTRNYRLLPSSPFHVPKNFTRLVESGGFGFDTIVNDFKVFRIIRVYTEDRYGYPEMVEKKVEIYELGIDIWRELDYADQQLSRLFWSTSSMFYKGAYHWITTSKEHEPIIFCFDMSTEIFRNMKPPNTREFSNGTLHSLLILSECLSLTCYPCLGAMIDPTTDLMEIWIMKDYNVYESWIKKYTITGLPTESPLAVWKDYLLLFQSKSGYLMSYDFNLDEIKELNFHSLSTKYPEL